MTDINIGFIGLGTMGYPIAKNINKNYKLYVWDRTPEVSKRHANENNSIYCETIDELVQNSDIIFTCLPTSNEVREVTNKFQSNSNTKYLVDCTSGNPEITKSIGEALKEKNINMLDAPISGGPGKAQTGTLCCMVGGDRAHYDYVKNVLDSFSKSNYVGLLGSAHALKSINNILNVSHLCMAMESIKSLEKYGVDLQTGLNVINNSSGRCLMTMERIPKDVITERYNYGFKLGLMKKDVNIALDIIGKDNKMFNNIKSLMEKAVEEYGFNSDYTEVSKLF